MFPIFFLPRRVAASTRKNIFDEEDRERKKDEPAARDVHAKLFKWAAPSGIRNSVKFRAKRKKSRGRIGLREFRNPRLYE